MSATFDPSELQQNNATFIDRAAPFNNEFESRPSILDSLRQSEVNKNNSNVKVVQDLLKQGKLKEAKENISNLLKQNPSEPQYYNLLALAQVMEKNALAAEQSYEKALAIDPNNITAHFGLALINLKKVILIRPGTISIKY